MAAPITIEYLAGFVDGEGCLSISEHARKSRGPFEYLFRAVLVIGNTDKQILLDIQEFVGSGSFGIAKKAGPRNKEAWQFSVSGRTLCGLLERLRPYLRVKAPQADVLLRFLSMKKPTTGRKYRLTPSELVSRRECIAEIRTLNKRGAQ